MTAKSALEIRIVTLDEKYAGKQTRRRAEGSNSTDVLYAQCPCDCDQTPCPCQCECDCDQTPCPCQCQCDCDQTPCPCQCQCDCDQTPSSMAGGREPQSLKKGQGGSRTFFKLGRAKGRK
jgi:hypothetical protein